MHTGYAAEFPEIFRQSFPPAYPESDGAHKKYTERVVIVNDRCPDKIPGTFRIDALSAELR